MCAPSVAIDLIKFDLNSQLIKSLGNLQTPEQKIAALAKNVIESDRQTSALKMNEKQMESILREKEHLQKEYNKGVLMR